MAVSPPPGGAPPDRFAFSTTDPDEAEDFIGQMYRARPPTDASLELTAPVAISQVSAGGMSYVDFTMPPDLTLRLDGTDDLSVSTLITGATAAELGRDTERYLPGDSFLGSFPGGDYTVRCVGARAGILTVPAAALAHATGALSGQPRPPLRFYTLRPASAAAARQWKNAATYAQPPGGRPGRRQPAGPRQRRPAPGRHRAGRLPQQCADRTVDRGQSRRPPGDAAPRCGVHRGERPLRHQPQ